MDIRTEVDFSDVLHIVRRYAPLVLLCTILAAAAAFVVSTMQRKQYTATAQVLFRNEQLDQQAAGLPVINNTNPQTETDTNLHLAGLPKIAAQTASVLGPRFTRDDVANTVAVTQVADTNLASVSATWTSPQTAARLANTYANEIVLARQRADAAYYANALRSVQLQLKTLTPAQQDGPQAADLKARQASLQTLAQLQSADVQVQQPAVAPTAPSAPQVVRNTVIGAVLGLLLGAGIAFLVHRFDRRLREPRDLEAIFGVPLIGVIPESAALKGLRARDGDRRLLPHREAEIFGLLRAHIQYFNVDRELHVIVVVSAAPGEGKTTVARNLALTSAVAGSRVLLVEADLRRPTVSTQLGVEARPGVAEVLLGNERLGTGVQHVLFTDQNGGSVSMDVLVAGGLLPPNPAQVTESSSMRALLQQARREYDFVVIDTPPLVLVPDAFPLLGQSDGVLVVSRLGRNRKDTATRLRNSLQGAGAPVVGVVANGVGRTHKEAYGYGADYAARAVPEPKAAPAAAGAAARRAEDDRGDAPDASRNGRDVVEPQPQVSGGDVVDGQPQIDGNGARELQPQVNGNGVYEPQPQVNGNGVLEPQVNGNGALEPQPHVNGIGAREPQAQVNGTGVHEPQPQLNGAERPAIPMPVRASGHAHLQERPEIPVRPASSSPALAADDDTQRCGSVPPPDYVGLENDESTSLNGSASSGRWGLGRVLGRHARTSRVVSRS